MKNEITKNLGDTAKGIMRDAGGNFVAKDRTANSRSDTIVGSIIDHLTGLLGGRTQGQGGTGGGAGKSGRGAGRGRGRGGRGGCRGGQGQ